MLAETNIRKDFLKILGDRMQNVTISKNEYLELLRYKEIVTVLEELVHGPAFKQEFIDRVRNAEKRVAQGEKVSFKSVEEMDKYLEE